jgi:hypothetical protein
LRPGDLLRSEGLCSGVLRVVLLDLLPDALQEGPHVPPEELLCDQLLRPGVLREREALLRPGLREREALLRPGLRVREALLCPGLLRVMLLDLQAEALPSWLPLEVVLRLRDKLLCDELLCASRLLPASLWLWRHRPDRCPGSGSDGCPSGSRSGSPGPEGNLGVPGLSRPVAG